MKIWGKFTICVLVILAIMPCMAFAASDAILPLFVAPLQEISRPVPYKKAVLVTHGWNSQAVVASHNPEIR